MIYIRQFRPLNLAIMLVLMLSVHFFLIRPIMSAFQLVLVLDTLHQVLLALSCTLIAAGGYLINNYYDYETDLQNKTNRVIADKNWLLSAYFPVTVTGIVLGIYVSYRAGMMNLAIVHIICTFALWKYAERWKGIALWGNLVVSLLLGILVLVPALFEFISLGVLNSVESEAFRYLGITLLVYALFAFWSNLCRELVKTLEDEKGDRITGWNTFTVRYGVGATRRLLWVLFILALGALLAVVAYQQRTTDWKPMAYTLFAVVLPLLISMLFFLRADQTTAYRRVSSWLKIWMLGGISTLGIYYLFFYLP